MPTILRAEVIEGKRVMGYLRVGGGLTCVFGGILGTFFAPLEDDFVEMVGKDSKMTKMRCG
jgi:hypothetical protein